MKSVCILVILCAFFECGYSTTENYPYVSWAVWHSIYKHNCSANPIDVIELCQRCAIFTKSPIVYPDCCDNRDNVLDWCTKAEAFGKISTSSA